MDYRRLMKPNEHGGTRWVILILFTIYHALDLIIRVGTDADRHETT